MKKKVVVTAALALGASMALSSCAGGSSNNASGEGSGEPSGDITVLTNRTDLVDTVFPEYVEKFQEKYPDVNVEFEALTDYDGDATIRLNSQDYGDVLLVPTAVPKDQFPAFFEPLGDAKELGEEYRFINSGSFEGQTYALPTFGAAMGYVYNRGVWEEAGITEAPRSEEEYLDALGAIADRTDAIPYYTNYADGWPLSSLQSNQGAIGGPDARIEMTEDDSPWEEGKDQYALDSLLWDTVAEGYSEPDPTTTNWEESKNLLATGQVGSMILGSWAIAQMQDAAEAAGESSDSIGFWPMPWQTDDSFTSMISPDKMLAVSKNSDNKPAARAWLDWFTNESGFAASQGGLDPRIDADIPESLADFEELGVEYVELAPEPEGKESLWSDIYNEAEIDLTGDQYRQEIIDIARGAQDGDKNDYFADLNERWAAARASVTD
jgi:raffinose/stachyose/melibiose transport system substrate-binding protein